MEKKEIGEMIRMERMKMGMNQKRFAQAIGVTPQQVCDWEKGRTEPTGVKMIKVVRFLKIDLLKNVPNQENI